MSADNDYCVIGLGKFGMSVVETLTNLGKVCLAIDKNEERVQIAADRASETLILDATNRGALEDAGIHNIKNIIIAVGSDLAASVITAVHILDLHKKYNTINELNIVAKAVDSAHKLLLGAIGINNIILPEIEAGKRAAYRAIWKLGLDLTAVDNKHSIANVTVKNERLINKKLQLLKIPDNYKINLIAIKRDQKVIIPTGNEHLFLDDEILFISANENISKVYQEFGFNNKAKTRLKENLLNNKNNTKKKPKRNSFFGNWNQK